MAVNAAIMKAALLFTHQKSQNIPINELSLSQQNKDPSCHSERRVLCSGPADSAVGWSGYDNAITGINVSVQKQPNCCCLARIMIRPGLERMTRVFFFFFCFAAIWSSNPTEPRLCSDSFGLTTWICKRTERGWVSLLYWHSEHLISTVSGCFDIFLFFLKTIFAVLWFLPFAVFHPKGMLRYQMASIFFEFQKIFFLIKMKIYVFKRNH